MNFPKFAKRLALVASLFGCISSNGVAVADDASSGNRAAYEAVLKCFVANGNAQRERLDAKDQDGAARYDANAKRSYNGAFKLGALLGLSDQRVNRDLDSAESAELPRMVKDRDYFIDAVATCKGLGLM